MVVFFLIRVAFSLFVFDCSNFASLFPLPEGSILGYILAAFFCLTSEFAHCLVQVCTSIHMQMNLSTSSHLRTLMVILYIKQVDHINLEYTKFICVHQLTLLINLVVYNNSTHESRILSLFLTTSWLRRTCCSPRISSTRFKYYERSIFPF